MKKFEYSIYNINHTQGIISGDDVSEFNKMGKEGWNMVSHSGRCVLFKREVK